MRSPRLPTSPRDSTEAPAFGSTLSMAKTCALLADAEHGHVAALHERADAGVGHDVVERADGHQLSR